MNSHQNFPAITSGIIGKFATLAQENTRWRRLPLLHWGPRGYIRDESSKGRAGMVFWVAAGVIVLMVLGVLVQSLRGRPADSGEAADLRVYRDQLREVERDGARGTIPPDEVQRLRAEISRRLLDADRTGTGPDLQVVEPPQGNLRAVSALIVVALAGSVWLYGRLGAPGYPDFALATRLDFADEVYRSRPGQDQAEANAPQPPISTDAALIARAETLQAAAQSSPDDTETLRNLALAEADTGDLVAARVAQARLIALKGPAANANDHATLGWMMITAAGGYVSPEAEAVLLAALAVDPGNGLARFYSGLMFAQVGRPDRAFGLWQPLLAEGPQTAPWMAPIRGSIEALAARAGIRYTLPDTPATEPSAPPGPSAADITAAAALSPEDRQAMIVGMVDGLAARLAAEGGPPEDWARLIGALATIGRTDQARTDQARAVLAEARALFATEAEALALVNAAALAAGLAE